MDSRDFSLYAIRLGAASSASATAHGYFDYLRFTRPNSGDLALSVQDGLMSGYASAYPAVTQRHGLEVSHYLPHLNWFGGDVQLPPYVGATKANWFDYIRQTIIPDIHTRGGLASYNHPYGTSFGPMKDQATQDATLRSVAEKMLPVKACGADILEVGYPMRGGMDITHHIGLWDVLSRNAIFLTGNGISDDHSGSSWVSPPNVTTWTTSAWAGDPGEASLLAALAAGRVWCASMTGYRGALDLTVDGVCPMGSVSVSDLTTRSLMVTATDCPTGGTVEVVQGVVDYAGTAAPTPQTQVVASGGTGGPLPVDTSQSSFVRCQVRDSAGAVVGLSNPVWLLREPPPAGIPAARGA